MDSTAFRFFQLENARLQEENRALQEKNLSLQRYTEVVRELFWAFQRIDQVEDPLELLDQLLYQVIEAIGAKDGSISYLDEPAGELVFVLVHGGIWQELRGYRLKNNTGVAGWVVQNREPAIVNQAQQDWRFSFEIDQEFNFLTHSIACVPIIAGDKLIGVIELLNKQGDEFTETDLSILSMLSQIAAKVLETVSV